MKDASKPRPAVIALTQNRFAKELPSAKHRSVFRRHEKFISSTRVVAAVCRWSVVGRSRGRWFRRNCLRE